MSNPIPSTEILAFREPVVNGDEIAVPVLLASGEWSVLRGTRSVWRQIAQAVYLAANPIAAAAKPAAGKRAPITKPGGHLL